MLHKLLSLSSSDVVTSLPPSVTSTQGHSPTRHISNTQVGGGEIGQLKLKLQYLEGMLGRMQKEKAGMDDEFGRQRKKFMQQMVDLECEQK